MPFLGTGGCAQGPMAAALADAFAAAGDRCRPRGCGRADAAAPRPAAHACCMLMRAGCPGQTCVSDGRLCQSHATVLAMVGLGGARVPAAGAGRPPAAAPAASAAPAALRVVPAARSACRGHAPARRRRHADGRGESRARRPPRPLRASLRRHPRRRAGGCHDRAPGQRESNPPLPARTLRPHRRAAGGYPGWAARRLVDLLSARRTRCSAGGFPLFDV